MNVPIMIKCQGEVFTAELTNEQSAVNAQIISTFNVMNKVFKATLTDADQVASKVCACMYVCMCVWESIRLCCACVCTSIFFCKVLCVPVLFLFRICSLRI